MMRKQQQKRILLLLLFIASVWFAWDLAIGESQAINGKVTPPLEMELSTIELESLPIPTP